MGHFILVDMMNLTKNILKRTIKYFVHRPYLPFTENIDNISNQFDILNLEVQYEN